MTALLETTEQVHFVWKGSRRIPLLYVKNMMTQLNYPQGFWNNVLWTDVSKVGSFGFKSQFFVW